MAKDPENGQKTAFVTGSNGFVGLNLCAALLAEGWHVIALHRQSSDLTYLQRLPVQLATGDILDRSSLMTAIPEAVDAIFHVAGKINTWSRMNREQTRINVEGTQNMVDIALAKDARRFVFTSSISAYGIQDAVIAESTPSVAASSTINYERDKWRAEEIVRQATEKGLSTAIMNPCAVMGPGDRYSWAEMIFMIRDGKLKALPPGHVPVSHIDEVTKAHIRVVDHDGNGENYILAGEVISFEALFKLMAECIGVSLDAPVASPRLLTLIAYLQVGVARITGGPPDLTPELVKLLCSRIRVDQSKAVRELGFQTVPVSQCVADCVDWLKKENLLTPPKP